MNVLTQNMKQPEHHNSRQTTTWSLQEIQQPINCDRKAPTVWTSDTYGLLTAWTREHESMRTRVPRRGKSFKMSEQYGALPLATARH
jgi:hypothetical protein